MRGAVTFGPPRWVCQRGCRPANEDGCSFGARHLLAVDGASGLFGPPRMEPESDARWLTQALVSLLGPLLEHDGADTALLLRQAADRLMEQMRAVYGRTPEEDEVPSAGLVCLRLRGGALEYFSLGDLTCLLALDGDVRVLRNDAIGRLDRQAIGEMVRLSRQRGLSVRQCRPLVDGILRQNRRTRNRPGGYAIFDPTGRGIAGADRAQWDPGQVRAAALMSDGFADAVPLYRLAPDWAALLARLETQGPQPLLDQLRAAQADDPDFTRYPRFKLGDDATALVSQLEHGKEFCQ